MPASRQDDVKPLFTSVIFLPVRMLSKTYPPAVASAQSRSMTRRTLPLIGIVRGLPFLLFSMSSQPGLITHASPLTMKDLNTRSKLTCSGLSPNTSPRRMPV